MSRNGVLPSSHYPDYLRQDLRIGETNVHPLAATLDEVFSSWFLLAQKSAHALLPQAWSDEACEAALEYHGLETKSLSPESRRELFRALPQIFGLKGTLAGIERLAAFYFSKATAQRGRADRAQGLGERIQLPLLALDLAAQDSLVIVRISSEASGSQIQEFTRNARLLMPDSFEILVAPEPAEPSTDRVGLAIGNGVRLERRRL